LHRDDGLAIEKRKKQRDIVFNVRESAKCALRRRAFGQFIDPEWREAIGLMMTAIDPWACSATDLLTAYASGAVSPVQVKAAVLEQAQRSAARWSSGSPSGPLDGIPVSIKDSLAAEGMSYWRGTTGNKHKPVLAA